MPTFLDSNSSDESSEASNKFWARPSRESPSPEVSDEGHVFDDSNSEQTPNDAEITRFAKNAKHSFSFTSTPLQDLDPLEQGRLIDLPNNRRRQTKLLLVSLIETFCRIYTESPNVARSTFVLISQTLRSAGFIDAEFVDEVASVRSTLHNAFQKLFITALHTARNQTPVQAQRIPRMIAPSSWQSPLLGDTDSETGHILQPEASQGSASGDVFHDLNVQNSRYCTDFLELGLLGKGGFASVWKVRNKLDGIEYAVKKVRLGKDLEDAADARGDNPYEKIFREIKHLARLEHHNVIRYYASWLEYDTITEGLLFDTFSEDEESYLSQSGESNLASHLHYIGGRIPPGDNVSNGSLFQREFSRRDADSPSDNSTPSSLTTHQSVKEQDFYIRSPPAAIDRLPSTCWILFIQMQICSFTLHDYIKQRNVDVGAFGMLHADNSRNIKLFSQILEGASYIHKQNLIHRDLKPSNIFLIAPKEKHRLPPQRSRDNDGRSFVWNKVAWIPKIGDFGLATVFDEEPREPAMLPPVRVNRSGNNPRRSMTTGVGTRTYASPEQLAAPMASYNEKADIYSLGIIFFELCFPFATAMERASAIDNLKKGTFLEGFVERHPKECALISWMMSDDPSHRPTAEQLLGTELFSCASLNGEINLHMQLRATSLALESKTAEVARLQKEIERLKREHADEMERMQHRLDELLIRDDTNTS